MLSRMCFIEISLDIFSLVPPNAYIYIYICNLYNVSLFQFLISSLGFSLVPEIELPIRLALLAHLGAWTILLSVKFMTLGAILKNFNRPLPFIELCFLDLLLVSFPAFDTGVRLQYCYPSNL